MKKAWKFFLENFDSLLAILMCFAAGILGTFGSNQSAAIAAIAAVLGILAYGFIRDRVAREKLLVKLHDLDRSFLSIKQAYSADRFFTTKTSEKGFIEQAKEEIWLLQETGSKVIEENLKTLERLIKGGGKVKLIIASSDEEIVELVALRNRNLRTDDIVSRQNDAIRKITSLIQATKNTSGSLEVRRLKYPLDITAVFVDPQVADAKYRMALIRMVGFRNFFDDKRDFKITETTEPDTFQYFSGQFKEMWQLAQEPSILMAP